MSNGRQRTFDEFGWTSGLTPSNQRIAVQSALASGERLAMPVGDPVQIDGTLVMSQRTELTGAGGDITLQAQAASQFRTVTPNIQMLRVESSDCSLSGFNLHADATGCTGIVLGDGVSKICYGADLDRITTSPSLLYGVHFLSAQSCTMDRMRLWGVDSALRIENPINSDSGDHEITKSYFNADPNIGAGIRWTSGGGLYLTGCKFVSGFNHVYMDWNRSGSGGLSLVNCSLENPTDISMTLQGSAPFNRGWIVGNTFAGPGIAIATRNFSPINFMSDLVISGNTIDAGGTLPIMDMSMVDNAFITGNILRGTGANQCGIYARSGTGAIGPNRISGCATPVMLPLPAGWAMAGQL